MSETTPVRPQAAPPAKTIFVLNRPLMLVSIATAFVAAISLFGWHRYQVHRTAGALREHAVSLQSQGDSAGAAKYLDRYLKLRPEDDDARVLLARSFDAADVEGNRNGRKIELYYHAIAVATGGEQTECRQRLAALLLGAQRYQESLDQAAAILKQNPDDPPASRLYALSLYYGHRLGTLSANVADRSKVFDALDTAWKLDRGQMDVATALALVYREIPEMLPAAAPQDAAHRSAAADRTLDELVAAASDDARAFICRHLYRQRYALEGAGEDMRRAVELAPDDVSVRILAGRYLVDQAQQGNAAGQTPEAAQSALDEAAAHFRHVIDQTDETSEAAHVGLGEALVVMNRTQEAIAAWESGLKALRAGSWVLNVRLAEAYTDTGDVERAALSVKAARDLALQMNPRSKSVAQSYDRLLELLEAQLSLRQGELAEAERRFRRAAAAGGFNASEAARAQRGWTALAEEQGKRGFWDRAAEAYEKATQLRPSSPSPRLGAAVAWHRAHRLDLAIPHYRELLSVADSAELWLALAKARFERNLLLPEQDRQWEPVKSALAEARARAGQDAGQLAEPWQLGVLEAEIIAAGGDEQLPEPAQRAGRVQEILSSVQGQFADEPELHARLALLYERLGLRSEADQAVEVLQRLTDGDARWLIVRARLEAVRGRYDAAKSLLGNEIARGSVEALRMLAGVCASDGDVDGVRAAWVSLYQMEPWSLEIPVQLAEMALYRADYEEAARWQNELERRGDEGQAHALYCAALNLLSRATRADDPRVEEARLLYRRIERLRPFWPTAYSLKGRLHELQGSVSLAVDAYVQAVDLGEQRTWVLQRVVVLLHRLRRFDEADVFLARLQTIGPLATMLETPRLAADEKGTAALVESSRKAVDRNPRDARARLWYGHLLLEQARQASATPASFYAQARRQFETAASLAPHDSEVWNGLFTYHLVRDEHDQARLTLLELVNRCELEGAQRAFVLAQGYELLGDHQAAFEQYELALEQSALRSPISLRMAQLALRSDPERAEQILRKLLKEDHDSIEARHALASLLATQGDPRRFDEAMSLLKAGAATSSAVETMRLQANLLLTRRSDPPSARSEARAILESLVSQSGAATPGDYLLLARVCERQFNHRAAHDHYLAAASSAQTTPEILEAYVDFLLRQGDQAAAGNWLRQLETRVKQGPRTLRLRARLMQAAGRGTEIEPLVEAYAASRWESLTARQDRIEFCRTIGGIYETAQVHLSAEPWYRRLFEFDASQYGPLALSMALQRPAKTDLAVQLCLSAAAADASATPVITLASVLVAANAPRDGDVRLQEIFARALEGHPRDADLLNALANLDIIQGDISAAAEKLKRVVTLRPDDALTMNNLAVLLADDRPSEAQTYLDQARAIVGDGPELMDTRAVLLLAQGQPEAAIEQLQTAISMGHDGQIVQLHLAAAFSAADMEAEARESFKSLDVQSIPEQLLTPSDKALLAGLMSQFDAIPGDVGEKTL